MKPNGRIHSRLGRGGSYSLAVMLAMVGAMISSTEQVASAGGVVTNCTETALRAATAGGGTVTFACDGTITLTSTIVVTTNVALNASGHQISISGVGIRLISVSPNVTLAIANLAIMNGSARVGGGVYNQGIVNATNCVFSDNSASFSGGALENDGGQVFLSGCVFTGNDARGSTDNSGSGSSGFGGALYNGGTLTADLCYFAENGALGGQGTGASGEVGASGGSGGASGGGAIFNSGTMTILRSTFMTNYADGGAGGNGAPGHHSDPGMPFGAGDGGSGGSGGAGQGGAIYNTGTARVFNATLAYNSGWGGSGGNGGYGGAAYGGGQAGGNGANGGNAGSGVGGVFNSGTLYLINSTLAFNSGSSGNGGAGGAGGGGTWGGHGGNGGNGGSGFGGICGGSCITNGTLALNSGSSGSGGTGGTGGAGSYSNGAPGASGSPGSVAGGIGSYMRLINTLLSQNAPGGNCFGPVIDLGHNLSSDSTCGFTAIGSMNNTDPKLGPLTNNGGPTLTMALLPGSPAIDAGDTSLAPATDQRGLLRPAGLAADIGGFEYGAVALLIGSSPRTQTAEEGAAVDLRVKASAGLPLFYVWYYNGTNFLGCTTNCHFALTGVQFSQSGTYFVVVSNAVGAVTSAPFVLNVIAAIERRPVPGVRLMGDIGSLLQVDSADFLSPVPNWTTLGSVSLSTNGAYWFDRTLPLAPQRFYRLWQTGAPATMPLLDLHLVPAITLTGNIGDSVRVDCINRFGPIDAWVTLDTVSLTNTSQLYFDTSAWGQPERLYQLVPVP